MTKPPCWPDGQSCPNDCADQLYQRVVYNHTPLHGPWEGWRMAGDWLIAPDRRRINRARVEGLLWREEAEARLAKLRIAREAKKRVSRMVTVVRIDQQDWHRERFGTVAG